MTPSIAPYWDRVIQVLPSLMTVSHGKGELEALRMMSSASSKLPVTKTSLRSDDFLMVITLLLELEADGRVKVKSWDEESAKT